MRPSRAIALSAICSAICALILTIGEYFPTLSLGAAFTAGIVIMIPLAKGSFKCAALTYLSGGALAFLLSFMRYEAILPFIAFFGLQPIVNAWQVKKGFNKYLMLAVKALWFAGVLVGYYYIFDAVLFDGNEQLEKFALPILAVGGIVLYAIYDGLSFYFQKYIDVLVKRISRK